MTTFSKVTDFNNHKDTIVLVRKTIFEGSEFNKDEVQDDDYDYSIKIFKNRDVVSSKLFSQKKDIDTLVLFKKIHADVWEWGTTYNGYGIIPKEYINKVEEYTPKPPGDLYIIHNFGHLYYFLPHDDYISNLHVEWKNIGCFKLRLKNENVNSNIYQFKLYPHADMFYKEFENNNDGLLNLFFEKEPVEELIYTISGYIFLEEMTGLPLFIGYTVISKKPGITKTPFMVKNITYFSEDLNEINACELLFDQNYLH